MKATYFVNQRIHVITETILIEGNEKLHLIDVCVVNRSVKSRESISESHVIHADKIFCLMCCARSV